MEPGKWKLFSANSAFVSANSAFVSADSAFVKRVLYRGNSPDLYYLDDKGNLVLIPAGHIAKDNCHNFISNMIWQGNTQKFNDILEEKWKDLYKFDIFGTKQTILIYLSNRLEKLIEEKDKTEKGVTEKFKLPHLKNQITIFKNYLDYYTFDFMLQRSAEEDQERTMLALKTILCTIPATMQYSPIMKEN